MLDTIEATLPNQSVLSAETLSGLSPESICAFELYLRYGEDAVAKALAAAYYVKEHADNDHNLFWDKLLDELYHLLDPTAP